MVSTRIEHISFRELFGARTNQIRAVLKKVRTSFQGRRLHFPNVGKDQP